MKELIPYRGRKNTVLGKECTVHMVQGKNEEGREEGMNTVH